jgi:hypothetical protein
MSQAMQRSAVSTAFRRRGAHHGRLDSATKV